MTTSNSRLQASSQCFNLIKHFESLHDGDLSKVGLQPKLCPAGVWTIGWGHAIVDPITGKQLVGHPGKKRALELFPTFSLKKALELLEADIEKREQRVRRLVAIGLKQFEFNLGALRVSALLRLLNKGDRHGAAAEFGRWSFAKVNGQSRKLAGLVKRRAAERHLFETGDLVLA